MTKMSAIQLAKDFSERQGFDNSQFDTSATKTDVFWAVFFRRKDEMKPAPGDFFTVYVNSQTQSVERIVHGK